MSVPLSSQGRLASDDAFTRATHLANLAAIYGRDNLGLTDVPLVGLDASDLVQVGDVVTAAGVSLNTAGYVYLNSLYTYLSSGAAHAATGDLRCNKTFLVAARDATNNNDIEVLQKIGASDIVWLGGDPALTNAKTCSQLNLSAQIGGAISMWVGGLDEIVLVGGLVHMRSPVVAYAAANSCWGAVDGQATQAVAGAGITLASDKYSRKIIKFTGAPAGVRIITFPHPADEDHSYTRILRGAQTVSALTISTGSGTTASLAVGTVHTYVFTPDGVSLVT